MHCLETLKKRSVSADELVLPYSDALELLELFERNSMPVSGWEGWLQYDDGSLGHSRIYQGTVGLSEMPMLSALVLVKSSITEANIEWSQSPEVSNAKLLFCIVAGDT